MFTVERALKSLARFNGPKGTCWDAPSNLERLNAVREMIYERGDYEGTVDWICVSLCSGCFSLPEDFESARHVFDACKSLPLVSQYAVIDRDTACGLCCCGDMICAKRISVRQGNLRRPYFTNPVAGAPIIAMNEDPEDDGTKIVLHAVVDGQKEDFEMILDSDECPTTGYGVTDLLSVTKPVTHGTVRLYSCAECYTLIAEYSATNENPFFTKYELINPCCSNQNKQLVILAKRKYMPLTKLTDLVDIVSMQALKFGYQALNAQQADDDSKYVSKIQLMEEQLEEADTNLIALTPAAQMHVAHTTAIGPEYD